MSLLVKFIVSRIYFQGSRQETSFLTLYILFCFYFLTIHSVQILYIILAVRNKIIFFLLLNSRRCHVITDSYWIYLFNRIDPKWIQIILKISRFLQSFHLFLQRYVTYRVYLLIIIKKASWKLIWFLDIIFFDIMMICSDHSLLSHLTFNSINVVRWFEVDEHAVSKSAQIWMFWFYWLNQIFIQTVFLFLKYYFVLFVILTVCHCCFAK